MPQITDMQVDQLLQAFDLINEMSTQYGSFICEEVLPYINAELERMDYDAAAFHYSNNKIPITYSWVYELATAIIKCRGYDFSVKTDIEPDTGVVFVSLQSLDERWCIMVPIKGTQLLHDELLRQMSSITVLMEVNKELICQE